MSASLPAVTAASASAGVVTASAASWTAPTAPAATAAFGNAPDRSPANMPPLTSFAAATAPSRSAGVVTPSAASRAVSTAPRRRLATPTWVRPEPSPAKTVARAVPPTSSAAAGSDFHTPTRPPEVTASS